MDQNIAVEQPHSSKKPFDSVLLDSLLAHVAILDKEGIILDTNEAWKSFNAKTGTINRSVIGTNYFKTLQQAAETGNDYALKFILGMNKVLKGNNDSFSMTYPLQTENHTFWFNLTLRSCNKDTKFIIINEDITSSMQTKNQLTEFEDRYQIQFEQSLDGIFITDNNGHIIDANPAASNILGWSREELLDRTEVELMDIDDASYKKVLQKRKESGSVIIEMDLLHKTDMKIPAEISSRAFRNKNGKPCAITTFRDISRRKQVEKDLIKNKQFTEAALTSNPGIFFVIDQKCSLVPWNDNFASSLGYDAKELSGKKVHNFVAEDQKEKMKTKIRACFRAGTLSFDTKLLDSNNQVRDYHIQANRFEQDGKMYIVGSGTDVTEKKEAELKIRKNQRMLEQLFDNAPIGITILDREDNIQQVNKSFEKIFNYSQKEVVGKKLNDLIVPAGKKSEAENISAVTHQGERLQTKSLRLTQDKREVPVMIGGIPVEYEDEVIAIYRMYIDISGQNEYQKKIEQALREKETLLAELHHRVKNNLALINSLLELQLFDSDDPQLHRNLSDVKKRIMTIATTHEVLYQNGNLSKIPIKKFLQELIDSGSLRNGNQLKDITINTVSEEFSLDIEQSIPCGLLLNELLSLIFTLSNEDHKASLDITLKQCNSDVHLIIEGIESINNPETIKEHQSLHTTLIDALVTQLDGQLIWPNSEDNHQKFELNFEKTENGHGPASQLLDNS